MIQFKTNFVLESNSTISNVSASQYKDILKLLVDDSNHANNNKKEYVVIANSIEAQNFWVNWIFSNNLASKEWLQCLYINLFFNRNIPFPYRPTSRRASDQHSSNNYILFHYILFLTDENSKNCTRLPKFQPLFLQKGVSQVVCESNLQFKLFIEAQLILTYLWKYNQKENIYGKSWYLILIFLQIV